MQALVQQVGRAATLAINIAALFVLPALGVAAQGNEFGPASDPVPAKMAPRQFISLDRLLPAGGIRLANGQKAVKEHWRSIALSTGATNCTASLIGRKVIVTSAHCVDGTPDGPKVTVVLGTVFFDNRTIALKECTVHPDYELAPSGGRWPRAERDFALCELKNPVSGIELETLADAQLGTGTPVTLMGFGCSALKVINGKLQVVQDPKDDRVLRVATHKVEITGLGYTGGAGSLVRTVSRKTEPNVCPGDSGGPVLLGINSLSDPRDRTIAAINSAFDGRWSAYDDSRPPEFYSYFSPATENIRSWIRKWSDDRGLVVCGIQRAPGADECRAAR